MDASKNVMRAVLFGLFLTPVPLFAQNTDTEAVDNNIETARCGDIMILAGPERDTSIAFMHGYIAHKSGDPVVDVEKVEIATEAFLQDCIENPQSNALEMLEKAMES